MSSEPEPGSEPESDTDTDTGSESDTESEPDAHDDQPGALLGGYRPSSLRLIDEAVAAAQAIEPSLFDGSDGTPVAPAPGEAETESVPQEIVADEPSPPRRTKRASAPPPPELTPAAR